MKVRTTSGALLSTVSSSPTASDLGRRLAGGKRALTYAEWLKKNGAKTDAADETDAKTKRELNSPAYGASVEKLIDRGLFRTGYVDYLRDRNEKVYRRTIDGIRGQNDARESGNRTGYLSYLKRWEDEQDALMQKTLSDLAENKVTQIDDAYADALAAGLTDERARLVSRIAPSVARYGMRRLSGEISGILAVSLSAGLSGDEAELLARACGVSESDAKKLRQTVESSPTGTTGQK